MQPQTEIPPTPPQSKPWLVIILSLFCFAALLASAYFYVQAHQLRKLALVSNTSPVLAQPTPLPTTDPTADWQTYTNESYNYSLKHPLSLTPVWGKEALSGYETKLEKNPVTTDQLWIVDENNPTAPLISINVTKTNKTLDEFLSSNDTDLNFTHSKLNQISTIVATKNNGQYLIAINNGYKYSFAIDQSQSLSSQILSTFKFTDNSPKPTPTIKSTSYNAPANWVKTSLMNGNLTLCLPPQWESDNEANIYYNRDSSYRPQVTYIQEIPYTSGSRREAYYQFWENEYPNVRNLVIIKEININGNTALLISPTNSSDPKSSPDGLALIWYANNKLWKAGLSSWQMINDSQTAFLKDIYTSVSCSF